MIIEFTHLRNGLKKLLLLCLRFSSVSCKLSYCKLITVLYFGLTLLPVISTNILLEYNYWYLRKMETASLLL